MPFGGRHPLSADILNHLVPKRLAKNKRIHRELAQSFTDRARIGPDGSVQLRKTISVEADKIEQLYRLIVHGLCWSEWKLLLPPSESEVRVGFLNSRGERMLSSLIGMRAKRRCQGILGGGLFQYEGVQAIDNDTITIWRMSLYGVQFMDADQSIDTTIACYGSSAPIGKALPINSD